MSLDNCVKIVLKRIEGAGVKPTPNDLLIGEIALNTSDNILFAKSAKTGLIVQLNFPEAFYFETLEEIARTKIDRVEGKTLSTHDFTDSLLEKLNGVEDGAEKNFSTTRNRFSKSENCALQAVAMNDHIHSDDHDGRYYTKTELATLIHKISFDRDFYPPTNIEISGVADDLYIQSSTDDRQVKIPLANDERSGLLGHELKKKLDTIEHGAEANPELTDRRDLESEEVALSAKSLYDHINSGDHDERYYTRGEVEDLIANTKTIVKQPQILAPLGMEESVPLQARIEGSEYVNMYNIPRMFRRIQIDHIHGDFSHPLYETTVNFNSHLTSIELPQKTPLKVRIRDEAIDREVSVWSEVHKFTTMTININPETIEVEGGPTGVPEDPYVRMMGLREINGLDDHILSDWRVLNSEQEVIWEELGSESLYLINLPKGILAENEDYIFCGRYIGQEYGHGEWAEVEGRTRSSFVTLRPMITSPTENEYNFDGPYKAYSSESSIDSVKWEISDQPDFSNVLVAYEGSENLLEWEPELDYILYNGQRLYVRMNHVLRGSASSWSNVVSFVPPAITIKAPSLTVEGEPGQVMETPLLEGGEFQITNSTDVMSGSEWQVLDFDGNVVWEKELDTLSDDGRSVEVDAGVLEISTAYLVRVRYKVADERIKPSSWSTKAIVTNDTFVELPDAGEPFGGGFYAGGTIIIEDIEYAIVVAPKMQGGAVTTGVKWKLSGTPTPDTDKVNDGLSNTLAMMASGQSEHPAASFCNSLVINGYDDWYLPSTEELEICYRYLKPTVDNNSSDSGTNIHAVPPTSNYSSSDPSQTASSRFQEDGEEFFDNNPSVVYWSSTQTSDVSALVQSFDNGKQSPADKTLDYKARATRRVAVRSATGSSVKFIPDITVQGAPDAVVSTPRLEATTFNLLDLPGVHHKTQWEIVDAETGDIVWELEENAASAISVPIGRLEPNKQYTFKVRYNYKINTNGIDEFIWSAWGEAVARTPNLSMVNPSLVVQGEPDQAPVQPLLTATAIQSSNEGWYMDHTRTEWMVARTSDNTAIWVFSGTITGTKTTMQVPLEVLEPNTEYDFRVQYEGLVQTGGTAANPIYTEYLSDWVSKSVFTPETLVNTPVIDVSTEDGLLTETPSLSTNEFSSSGWSLEQTDTEWSILKDSDGSEVFNLVTNDTDLRLGVTLETGIIEAGVKYKFRVRKTGRVRTGGTSAEPVFTMFTSDWVETSRTAKNPF